MGSAALAGTWNFRLDAADVGVAEKWYAQKFEDTVRLPGTTDENHKGIFKDEKCVDRLSRVWFWKGPAWYQKQVTIPESWTGKRITLLFERTKNTRVWVNETFCGWEDTLSAAQVFDVTKAMTPSKHTITVVVDNAKLPPVGPSHAVDERTQTNWNGIVGKMELRATAPVWLEDIQVYPNAVKKEALVRTVVGNITGQAFTGDITVGCKSYNVDKPSDFKGQTVKVKGGEEKSVVEFTYKPDEDVPLWDEFNPAMLKLTLKLQTKAGEKQYSYERSVSFGMRDFTKNRNRLMINGKSVFLRGRTDSANYPLTGYPPMDKAEWLRLLSIAKSWGINHYRFHSWCPPQAAFEAADELGVYFQPEFPNKRSAFGAGENKEAAIYNIDRLDVKSTLTKVSLYDYAKREGELIFKNFGNHPSFVMFTLGNELGRNPGMRSVRKGDWKLIKYDVMDGEVRQTQLFNLKDNPDELLKEHRDQKVVKLTGNTPKANQVNLAGNPKYAGKLAEMEALLLSEMRRLNDPYRLWDQPDGGPMPLLTKSQKKNR